MLNELTTESENPRSQAIDALSAGEIVRLMNSEDQQVINGVEAVADEIAKAVEITAERIRRGGRLIYIGAGTSGRLGVLDASECPPTFSTPREMVVGLIAGGNQALTRSIEGAEDHPEDGVTDLKQIQLSDLDVVVGIATSGRTPYVLGALQYAQEIGAAAIGLTCNAETPMAAHADFLIAPIVGPEVISGSTRLKAGTATKLVLNSITTGTMVLLGKTYGNLMVDLTPVNEKLRLRSKRIVARLTGISEPDAQSLLEQCDGEVKTAIVMQKLAVSATDARERIANAQGQLRVALNR